MDQDSFRQLVQSSGPNGSNSSSATPAVSTQKPSRPKPKKAEPSQPNFKPRTVKKASTKDGSYRDRAAERRLGKDSDYAQIEALAEDFERRAAAEQTEKSLIEEQRKYLGGDGDHSVLVKGLDFALLEANKARAVASTVDDDSLEQAFIEGASSAAPATVRARNKKRTREDIVQELKNKRPKSGDDDGTKDVSIEQAKTKGKFKPIGFKPIGASAEEGKTKKKGKKTKVAEEEGVKRKKKKATEEETQERGRSTQVSPPEDIQMKAGHSNPPEPTPEDFDIFADAGEYVGLDLGDDDDEKPAPRSGSEGFARTVTPPAKTNWFGKEEEGEGQAPPPADSMSESALPPPRQASAHEPEEGEATEEETPIRLVPLVSSSIPSIKDILAMDDAAKKEQKRKARKEKKKSVLGAEEKVDRDYQRLKSYTEKKAAASQRS